MLLGSLLGSGAIKAGASALSQIKSNIPKAVEFINTPASLRLSNGLGPGGSAISQFGSIFREDGSTDTEELVVTGSRRTSGAVSPSNSTDMRVRLSAQESQRDQVYGSAGADNILSILHETNGMLFPYTPNVSISQDVDYKTIDLVHSNYDINAYSRTPSVSVSITGKFTVQNKREGVYAIAVLHYLRTVSKIYFGEKDAENGRAGLPPPVLLLNGYGTYMFNNLRVVVKSHSYNFDESVDMVDVSMDDGTKTRVPSLFTISLNLGVQQTPTAMRKEFSLDDFRTGALMRRGGGWI